ncbi:unnamed protein product [Boreogadus saida]
MGFNNVASGDTEVNNDLSTDQLSNALEENITEDPPGSTVERDRCHPGVQREQKGAFQCPPHPAPCSAENQFYTHPASFREPGMFDALKTTS